LNELLDWAERNGQEYLRQQHTAADDMIRTSDSTLTLAMAALFGTLGYSASKGFWEDPVARGALWAACYLFLVTGLLVWRCLFIRDIPSITNEPRNLYKPDYSLDALKEAELDLLQQRIDEAKVRNNKTARWLNGLRSALLATPLVFAAGALNHPSLDDPAAEPGVGRPDRKPEYRSAD